MKKLILFFLTMLFSASVFAQANWFMAQTEKASVKSVVASSELVEAQFEGKYLYPPINILDGNFENTWCEAEKNGDGIGESVTVEFFEPVSFDEIQVVNGFASPSHPDYYKKNNRIKTLQITQVAQKHFQQKDYPLSDNSPNWQSVKFGLPQTAQTITFKIKEVYKGTKYTDTCLDDVRLLYKGKVIPFENVANLKIVQEENSKQMLKSNIKDFEKQFFGLFKGSNKLYLRNSDKDFVIIRKNSYEISELVENQSGELLVKNTSKEKLLSILKNRYTTLGWSIDGSPECYAIKNIEELSNEKLKSKYFLIGTHKDRWSRYYYTLGNYRIIKHEQIGYVEMETVTIVKLDGNNIYLNGVKYEILSEDDICDIREFEGI